MQRQPGYLYTNLYPIAALLPRVGLQAKKNSLIDLPIPAIGEVADYEQFTRRSFVPPTHLVRRTLVPDAAEYDAAPSEYDLEREDEVCQLL